jgi:hypothetical protein
MLVPEQEPEKENEMSHPSQLSRADWIKFRAEQLAVRAEPVKFAGLYALRATHFGTERFSEVHKQFCSFLQPFINDASHAWAAENEAARHLHIQNELNNMLKPVTPYAGEGTVELDEDQDEVPTCQTCGAELYNDEDGICEECEIDE